MFTLYIQNIDIVVSLQWQCAYAPAAPPAPPAPVVVAPAYAYAPDYYAWDGYEYVGVNGDQYVYWGGSAWIICDPVRVERFHVWIGHNPGWRARAIPDPHGGRRR